MAANTPTSEIQNALSAALDLTTLVHQTINGLLGVIPEPKSLGSSGIEVTHDGVLPRMASTARYTKDQINLAMAALRRLQDQTDTGGEMACEASDRGYVR